MGRKKKPPARPLSEVEAAISNLSDAELLRLNEVAERLMTAVSWAGLAQDHSDLLSEAITKTLSGERSWPQDVPMIPYFHMTMKSIRANWIKGELQGRTVQKGAAGDVEDIAQLVELLESLEPGPERIALAREKLKCFMARFSDMIETRILNGLGEGLADKEIQAKLGISANEYSAARKRIKRKLLLLGGEDR